LAKLKILDNYNSKHKPATLSMSSKLSLNMFESYGNGQLSIRWFLKATLTQEKI